MRRTLGSYLATVGCAIALGVLGDGLFRVYPGGLNLTVWVLAALMAGVMLAHWDGSLTGRSRRLMFVAAVFCLTFIWRDSVILKCLSGFAVFATFALASQWTRAFTLRLAGVTSYLTALVDGLENVVGGASELLFRDYFASRRAWAESSEYPYRQWLLAAMRGLLVAIPLVFVFGLLFVSADLAFESLVMNLFDLQELLKHGALILVFAWLGAGILKGLLKGSQTDRKLPDNVRNAKFGAIEAGVVMTLLDLLFLVFVVVQFRYLFGGEQRIREISDLSYADYARKGFFELCTVTGLVLCLQMVGDWLLRDATAKGRLIFRLLAACQLAMVVVVMASAFFRMRMYQAAYGLTEPRLYVTAFMVWLGVLLIWFAIVVLMRGRRERFAFGVYVSGLIAIMALHAVNPDALIVKANAARFSKGKDFDLNYAISLSADAVPSLLSVLPDLKVEDIQNSSVPAKLKSRWNSVDWRAWNCSRARAVSLVSESEPA